VQEFYQRQWNLNAPLPTDACRWLKSGTFDLINSRFLVDGIDVQRWEPLVLEYKVLLKHKAWLQMAEVQWKFHSQSNRDLPALKKWSKKYYEALCEMGKRPDVAEGPLEHAMRWAGFEHVNCTTHRIPVGEWRAGTSNYTLLSTSKWALWLTRVQKTTTMKSPPV
jgi:hypothetical protein